MWVGCENCKNPALGLGQRICYPTRAMSGEAEVLLLALNPFCTVTYARFILYRKQGP